jgi:hypothetical protein
MEPAVDTQAEFDAQWVRRALECSAAHLEAPALARLRDARMLAMGRFEARRSVPGFVWAHNGRHALPQQTYYRAAAAFCAVLLLGGVAWWQQQAAEHDESDTDIAILTDDLPMDVYVE